jgi:hypothetical protein
MIHITLFWELVPLLLLVPSANKGLHKASILLLFCAWRDFKNQKNGHDTFTTLFMDFEKRMLNNVRECIYNIQSYHECRCIMKGPWLVTYSGMTYKHLLYNYSQIAMYMNNGTRAAVMNQGK